MDLALTGGRTGPGVADERRQLKGRGRVRDWESGPGLVRVQATGEAVASVYGNPA